MIRIKSSFMLIIMLFVMMHNAVPHQHEAGEGKDHHHHSHTSKTHHHHTDYEKITLIDLLFSSHSHSGNSFLEICPTGQEDQISKSQKQLSKTPIVLVAVITAISTQIDDHYAIASRFLLIPNSFNERKKLRGPPYA